MTKEARKKLEREIIQQLLGCEKYQWLNAHIQAQYWDMVTNDVLASSSSLPPARTRSSISTETLVVSLASKEYLNLGRNWLRRILDAGVKNVYVVCADRQSHEYFSQQGIHCTRFELGRQTDDLQAKNFSGFTAKGLLLADLRYLACKEGLEKGYNVVFSDLDALWMKNAIPHLTQLGCDFAFQSVRGFPKELVDLWGFSACSGFFYLRACDVAQSICRRMIELLKNVASDQLVMNTVLSQLNIEWTSDPGGRDLVGEHASAPYPAMRKCLIGHGLSEPVKVAALPQNLYRRHLWMQVPIEDALVLHPNSPKEESPKLDIFRQLGIEIV